jgi:hypothetical protein
MFMWGSHEEWIIMCAHVKRCCNSIYSCCDSTAAAGHMK